MQQSNNGSDLSLFMEKCKEILVKYFEDEPEKTIFHYTNFRGLKGIIESKQLWLTEYRHLNDPSEINYAFSRIKLIIKKILTQIRRPELWEDFMDYFDEILNKYINLYVGSFCLRCNYLPAWRWYGDDGKGYAIGFRAEFFKNKSRESVPAGTPMIGTLKIHYHKENCFEPFIMELINLTEEQIINVERKGLFNDDYYFELFSIVGSHIVPVLAALKHEAYEEENEYRLYELEQNDSIKDDRKFWRPNPRVNEPFVGTIPATKVSFEPNDISEIWVGPRCDFDNAKYEIKKLLQEQKFDVKNISIHPSDIPYRNSLKY